MLITLAEFNSRAAEFSGNLAAASLMIPNSPEWKIFHIEDISNEACWLSHSDDELPKGTIYITSNIGHYLDHEEALYMLYAARRILQFTAELRRRYSVKTTALVRSGACVRLRVLPHDPPAFCNPVQSSHVNYMMTIAAENVTCVVLFSPRFITIEHRGEDGPGSYYKIRWDHFADDPAVLRAVVARVEYLNKLCE